MLGCDFLETSAKYRVNVEQAFCNLVRAVRRYNKVSHLILWIHQNKHADPLISGLWPPSIQKCQSKCNRPRRTTHAHTDRLLFTVCGCLMSLYTGRLSRQPSRSSVQNVRILCMGRDNSMYVRTYVDTQSVTVWTLFFCLTLPPQRAIYVGSEKCRYQMTVA